MRRWTIWKLIKVLKKLPRDKNIFQCDGKNQINQFFRKVFAKVKNGHFFSEKNVQNQDPQKSFGKKNFFFIVTNEKTFFRKWERFLGKSLFSWFFEKSQKNGPPAPKNGHFGWKTPKSGFFFVFWKFHFFWKTVWYHLCK